MSLKIELGLFNLDFTDHHAILGVPVDAELKDIRKRYLTIARRLHPDSFVTNDESDRQRASELLSKLVNPAYEKLSQEKTYNEYCVLLKLKGQQALRQQETVLLTSDSARRLAGATGDIEQPYRTALKELTTQQYENLDKTLEVTGQISELNMVYLMRKSVQGDGLSSKPKPGSPPPAKSPSGAASPAPARSGPPAKDDLVHRAWKRSQEFETKQDFTKAILELREALQIDPNNATTHTRLGSIYLKTKQPTMAKIHFRKALELNPQDPIALASLRTLDPNAVQAAKSSAKAEDSGAKSSKNAKSDSSSKGDKPGNSGGLFGLFGGKKK